MLRLCLPLPQGFPLCSPAKICSQLVTQQSRLVGFDVKWEGWSRWGAEKILLVVTCLCVSAISCSSSLPLPHFLLFLHFPSSEPLGVFCCAHSLSILIPASRASPTLRMLCLPLVITEL